MDEKLAEFEDGVLVFLAKQEGLEESIILDADGGLVNRDEVLTLLTEIGYGE